LQGKAKFRERPALCDARFFEREDGLLEPFVSNAHDARDADFPTAHAPSTARVSALAADGDEAPSMP
jgi:hypothetical protein